MRVGRLCAARCGASRASGSRWCCWCCSCCGPRSLIGFGRAGRAACILLEQAQQAVQVPGPAFVAGIARLFRFSLPLLPLPPATLKPRRLVLLPSPTCSRSRHSYRGSSNLLPACSERGRELPGPALPNQADPDHTIRLCGREVSQRGEPVTTSTTSTTTSITNSNKQQTTNNETTSHGVSEGGRCCQSALHPP